MATDTDTNASEETVEDSLLASSPCKQRGAEMPFAVIAREDDKIDAFFLACQTPVDLRLALHATSAMVTGGKDLFNGELTDPEILVPIRGLTRGFYNIHWNYLTTGPQWEAVAEIWINGVAMFRKRNSFKDDRPASLIFSSIKVV